MFAFCAFCAVMAVICSCGKRQTVAQGGEVVTDSTESPKYAKGYSVRTTDDGVRLVDVADPQSDKDRMPVSYHFALVKKGAQATVPEGYTRVDVPIDRTIVMTMLQLSNFTALDALRN